MRILIAIARSKSSGRVLGNCLRRLPIGGRVGGDDVGVLNCLISVLTGCLLHIHHAFCDLDDSQVVKNLVR